MEEVLLQFLGVFFLLFPQHFSSHKSLLKNKRFQRLYTEFGDQYAPARAKRIDRQRNLSPVKIWMFIREIHKSRLRSS